MVSMLSSYKTLPTWPGGLWHFTGQSQKYLPRGQDNRERCSALERKKEPGQNQQNAAGTTQQTCVNQHSPLPRALLYPTSSNQGPDPTAWQASSQRGLLLPLLWDAQSCIAHSDTAKASPYSSQPLKSPLLWLGSAKKNMQAAKAVSEPIDSFGSEFSCSKTWSCGELRNPGRLWGWRLLMVLWFGAASPFNVGCFISFVKEVGDFASVSLVKNN